MALPPRRRYKDPLDDLLWNVCLFSMLLSVYIGQLQLIGAGVFPAVMRLFTLLFLSSAPVSRWRWSYPPVLAPCQKVVSWTPHV